MSGATNGVPADGSQRTSPQVGLSIIEIRRDRLRETTAMADPNNPFPDMSLPDRDGPAGASWPAPPARRPLPPQTGVAPGVPSPAPPSAGGSWRVGDRVLAPWEPMCRYVGRIDEIRGDLAFIRFDDGDSAWLPIELLRPFELSRGQTLHARRDSGKAYHPAELLEWSENEVRLAFEDGTEVWLTVDRLRILEPQAARLHDMPPSMPGSLHDPQEGDHVWAPWEPNWLYAGVIDRIEGMEAHIHFGNGNQGWVQLDQLSPLTIPLGLRIRGRWLGGSVYYTGTVNQIDGDRIHIQYDDGDREWTTPDVLAFQCNRHGPSARPTRRTFRFPWQWLITPAIVIGILSLRSCR
jgi:hypothetical protein